LKFAPARRAGGRHFGAAAVGLIAALALPPMAPADDAPAAAAAGAQPGKPPVPVSAAAMAEYRRLLAEYNAVHDAYVAAGAAYWSSVGDKRKLRFSKRARNAQVSIDDYVLTQPPVYSGPPKPVDPSAPKQETQPAPAVPVVADFLAAAKQEYNFTPRRPQSDIEFKRAYAPIAAAAGLTRDQAVRIYGFEATGNGTYDLQAGLEYNKPGARAITTALGYNQLLATNSVELMAESGDKFIASLAAKANGLPEKEKAALQNTIAVVKTMIAFARSVPDDWSQHEILAGTPKGLAVHAMNLDLDVGPLLQTQKLLDSVVFARRKGYGAALTAAELEMMNLTGDGNGFDMIVMPADWRGQVPTTNFFQRRGYSDNPVAQRNNTVAALLAATDAAMDQEIKKQGAKDLAAVFPK
jgi:hypothetical protein